MFRKVLLYWGFQALGFEKITEEKRKDLHQGLGKCFIDIGVVGEIGRRVGDNTDVLWISVFHPLRCDKVSSFVVPTRCINHLAVPRPCAIEVLCIVSRHRLRSERWSVAFRRAELRSRSSEHHVGQRRGRHCSHKHLASSDHRHATLLWR